MRHSENGKGHSIKLTSGDVSLSLAVVDVTNEKLDPSQMAREIYEKTDNGTVLPAPERQVVDPFLDPSFDTDDIATLEKFIKIYENALSGKYTRLSPDADPLGVEEDGLITWRGRVIRKFPDREATSSEDGKTALENIVTLCREIEASGGEVGIISLAQLETRKRMASMGESVVTEETPENNDPGGNNNGPSF